MPISIHALRVEGDSHTQDNGTSHGISIHALRVEGDRWMRSRMNLRARFLSTPSGWRATAPRRMLISLTADFYPRPPGGGRLSHSMFPRTAETISIHALRVEGDKIAPFVKHLHYISIHALRVEGDKSIFDRLRRRIRNFYPRPPGGGRPSAFHPYTPAV